MAKAKKQVNRRLIQNYGLFWRWDFISQGSRGRRGRKRTSPETRGRIWGTKRGSKKWTDFADQRGVYALYAGFEFVYAGQIDRRGLLRRLKEHRDDDLAERWDKFSFFGTRRVLKDHKLGKVNIASHPSVSTALNQLEAMLIQVSAPSLNNSRGKWSGATRYYQVRDERLGKTTDEMVRELYKKSPKPKPKK